MRWSLNAKMTVLFLALGLCFAVGGYAVLRSTILPTFLEFEEEAARQDRASVSERLDQLQDDVRFMNLEYSIWDQTYDYLRGVWPQFVEENLDPSYWRSVDIDLMTVFDSEGIRRNAILVDPVDRSTVDIDWALDEPLTGDHPLVRRANIEDSLTGIVQTRLGPMLVASFPVLTSDGSGPVAGAFVTGQILTPERVARIAELSATNVHYFPTNLGGLEPQIAGAIGRLMESGKPVSVEIRAEAIHSYELLRDIFGQPAGVLEIVSPRKISRIGNDTLRAAGWTLAAACAVFLLAALLFMNRLIAGPIRRLTGTILSIRETGNLAVGIEHRSSDEVGVLASEFNALTERLDSVKQELEGARDEALESARAKSEFLARMSHEIRTPMNGVIGMTELLRDTPLNLKQQRFAGTIHESAEALLAIINDILDFSKIEADSVRLEEIDVDMRALIEETLDSVAMSAAAKGVELINEDRLALDCAVRTDPVRLRQILTNLLSNGIKFTAEGEVTLRASLREETDDAVCIRFDVRDTGIGIKREKQQEIFGAFAQEDGSTTRLYGGTGLGLAISRQLVEMMGGALTLDSAPGAGSTFSFSLRLQKGESIARPESGHIRHIAGSRVLIVDDNATNREILEYQLRGWRAMADSAVSADDALAKLEAAVASGQPYDFALLDVHMPGKDGVQLAEAIRRNPDLHELRLLILSSVAESVSESKMSELCVSGQLSKPVRQAHLYRALVAMLGGNATPVGTSPPRARQLIAGRVLLAEDNPVNQVVARHILENLGLEVLVAEDGEEALRKARSESIDLILMDCQMPKMDGFEATRALREEEKATGGHLPIIALTANALDGDREKCLELGMDEYLSKPFTSEAIESVLTLFLDSKQPARQSGGSVEHSGSPHGPAGDRSPLDRRVLEGLAGTQQSGGGDFVRRLIDIYLESATEARSRLSQAIAAQDRGRIVEIAHNLKSGSANVGAMSLAELCGRLERTGESGDFEAMAEVHGHLDREIAVVMAALRVELEALSRESKETNQGGRVYQFEPKQRQRS